MRILVLIVALLITNPVLAQEPAALGKAKLFKGLYEDFLKYGTIYGAGDISNSIEAKEQTFFVRTNQDGSLYSIPDVVDNTPKYPFDYRLGIGIRKLARFNYERKPKNFYDGTEPQLAFTAPTSALDGLEYQFHWENERWRGEEFKNHRVFVKHTGKYHIAKFESREVDKINLEYVSGEIRARLPIGKKFSISAGAIYRTHSRAYGYNPIEIWLNETEMLDDGNGGQFEIPVNQWYTLGFEYGYSDHYTTYTDANTGNTTSDWIWKDSEGNIVAYTDLEFRENVFTDLMNRYNNEKWAELNNFAEVAPIIGFDFYHYEGKFWMHAYGNYILPYHQYVQGSKDFSYLNRSNWGMGGLKEDSKPEQWDDYSAGINMGWKINKNLGVFIEGEYSKMWDSELYVSTFGLNYTFK
jgi:hypothetical protein|tara:strand:- start:1046 stop:2275 length:1230 start_codon:yes stop_codon:yes gene_type:complete